MNVCTQWNHYFYSKTPKNVLMLKSWALSFPLSRYGELFPVSAEVLDPSFVLPIGKAKVRIGQCTDVFLLKHVLSTILNCFLWKQIEREGTDVTITAFSKMVGFALKVSLGD